MSQHSVIRPDGGAYRDEDVVIDGVIANVLIFATYKTTSVSGHSSHNETFDETFEAIIQISAFITLI